MKWLVYVLLFLGIEVALTAIYWVIWTVIWSASGHYIDFWCMSGVLSTLGLGYLMIKGE
jgi:hypothetical protein